MDFTNDFESCFQNSHDYTGPAIDLGKKLQDTRHALQESQSEVEQLKEMIEKLYSESRIENVSVTEIVGQMKHQLFRNIPLPRNADNLPFNERVGYALYYLKFLGYATRKAAEEYHNAKDHLELMQNAVKANTVGITVVRTSALKIPELDGHKELKKIEKPASISIDVKSKDSKLVKTPISPPATPPENRKEKKEKK